MSTGPSATQELQLMSSVLDAKDKSDLLNRMMKAVKSCGFESFLIGLEVHQGDAPPVHHVTSAYPEKWQRIYVDRGYAMLDPTVAYCQRNTAPLIWNEAMFLEAGCMPLLEEAQTFGVSHGISASFHEPGGNKSMLSLARDQQIGKDQGEKDHLVAYSTVLSSCMHVMASRFIVPEVREESRPRLTRKELECLKWVAQGKTAWEIGQILNVAEPTVVFHLKNVMRKLNVVNRHQAMVVAMRMGYIE